MNVYASPFFAPRPYRGVIVLAHALGLCLPLPALAVLPGIELVDRTTISSYIDSNGESTGPLATSADDRFMLFTSAANNLVSGDTNGLTDMFVHDASDGSIERVNVASDGSQANGAANPYLYDSQRGGISADGRYVVFPSVATNLVAEPTGGYIQAYRRDRITGTTTLISRGTDGLPATAGVSLGASTPDGRYTVLATAASNFPDTGGRMQVFRRDATDGSLVRVSVSFDGQATDAGPDNLEISDDGRFVLFSSYADNVLPGGAPLTADLFLRDLQTGTTQQVTVTETGAPAPFPPNLSGGDTLNIGLLSGDGRYVVFSANAPLAAADTDSLFDVYRFDRLSGTTTLISTTVGSVTPLATNRVPSISADGNRILFASLPSFAPDPAALFVRDMAAGTLTPLAIPPLPFFFDASLALSRDGSQAYIASRQLPPRNELRQVYRFDIAAGVLARISRAPASSFGAYANGSSQTSAAPSPDASASLVAFASVADNLVSGDTNGASDVFVRDHAAATTTRISRRADGSESPCASTSPTLTPDARYVVFVSCGALALPASGDQNEIYRHDRASGAIELVSVGAAGERADGGSFAAHVSADGRYVAFASCARNLAPVTGGALCQVYLRDMDIGATVLVSRSSAGQPASGFVRELLVSGNGRFVGYSSDATNLVGSDTNGKADVFVFDRITATTERVSVGPAGVQGNGDTALRGFDHTGNLALLFSTSTNFAPVPSEFAQRTFLRDRSGGTTTLLAIPGDTRAASTDPSLSPDGRFVALISASADSGTSAFDDSRQDKLFVLDRSNGSHRALTWFTQASSDSLTRKPQLSADGRSVVFVSTRSDLTGDDGNGMFANVFLARLDDAIFANGFQ